MIRGDPALVNLILEDITNLKKEKPDVDLDVEEKDGFVIILVKNSWKYIIIGSITLLFILISCVVRSRYFKKQ